MYQLPKTEEDNTDRNYESRVALSQPFLLLLLAAQGNPTLTFSCRDAITTPHFSHLRSTQLFKRDSLLLLHPIHALHKTIPALRQHIRVVIIATSTRTNRQIVLLRCPCIRPDAGPRVAGAGSKKVALRTRRDRDNRVLVSLKHELGLSGARIPELDASILGAREDPLVVRCEGHTEHKVLFGLSALF
jgi:hypothetical protein